MSTFRFFQFCTVFVFAGLSLTWLQAQEKETPSAKVAPKSLREALLGAWASPNSIDAENELKPGGRMKMFGLKHWIITESNPETGELVFHHGGTYKIEGDIYEETIKFAALSTKELIGRTFKFKIAVDRDMYEQVGIGNNYNEKLKRLKSE